MHQPIETQVCKPFLYFWLLGSSVQKNLYKEIQKVQLVIACICLLVCECKSKYVCYCFSVFQSEVYIYFVYVFVCVFTVWLCECVCVNLCVCESMCVTKNVNCTHYKNQYPTRTIFSWYLFPLKVVTIDWTHPIVPLQQDEKTKIFVCFGTKLE